MKENFTSKKKVFSWALFDFANQPFSTIIITFIFSTYFISNIGNASLWSLTIGISSLMIAFFSPFIGAVADVSNTRNFMFKLFTYLCVISCFFLYLPPSTSSVLYSLTFVIIANFSFEISCMFYNSYLSEISTKRNIGRISGYAWGLGFFGGVLSLLIVKSLFNLESTNINISQSIREINLFIGVWFLIFSIPFFYIIRNRNRKSPHSYSLLVIKDQFVNSYNEIRKTFNEVRKYKKIAKFLLSRLFYNDALITIFAFGGSFAEQVLGFDIADVILFAIVLNVSAGIGSFIFGFIEDKVGAVRIIDFSLKGLILATFLAFVSPFLYYDIQLFG